MTEPSSSNDIPWTALGRYFAGELRPDERTAIERWIAAAPERSGLVDELRQVWAVAPALRGQWEVEAAIRRVMQPTAAPARIIRLPAFYREAPGSLARRRWRLVGQAAAAIALLGGGIWAIQRPASNDSAMLAAASEVRTLRGQQAALRLPDGSEVQLGPASTIRYTVDPRHGARTVSLDGEAYFVVTHDTARPFTVHTAYGIATDLGTRFGVRAYRSDSVVKVGVEEGLVSLAPLEIHHSRSVTGTARHTILAAHDLGLVTPDGRVTVERGGDVATHLAWKDGRLELPGVPLREAVVELSRWYGVDIHLGDNESASRRLHASFQHESASEALQLIAATLALRIERQGAAVILWSQRPS